MSIYVTACPIPAQPAGRGIQPQTSQATDIAGIIPPATLATGQSAGGGMKFAACDASLREQTRPRAESVWVIAGALLRRHRERSLSVEWMSDDGRPRSWQSEAAIKRGD